MGKLNGTYQISSGNIKSIAKNVGAGNAFINTCNVLIIKSYNHLILKKNIKPDWEEDTFTANFYTILESLCAEDETPFNIDYQQHQLTSNILSGATRAQTAKKIDIVFSTFGSNKLSYGIEAKILAENNYLNRNAQHLNREYIISGIDRFTNNDYNISGCMVGYVMNGNADNVANKINEIFKKEKRVKECLQGKFEIENYEFCYVSKHRNFILHHLLLQILN